ncbi:MAG: hypothetical protein ACE366_18990 [Bradymonadia bacterium]
MQFDDHLGGQHHSTLIGLGLISAFIFGACDTESSMSDPDEGRPPAADMGMGDNTMVDGAVYGEDVDFIRLLAAGACPSPSSPDAFTLSVLPYGGPFPSRLITPDDRFNRPTLGAGEALSPEAFQFSCFEEDACIDEEANINIEDVNGARTNTHLDVEEVEFRWTAGTDHVGNDRLVIFMMDNSVSLLGGDVGSPEIDTDRATDPNRRRITFMRELIEDLPTAAGTLRGNTPTWISIMKFDALPEIDAECASPTLDREIATECFDRYSRGEDGPTNLRDALVAVHAQIVSSPAAEGLSPMVVLFTDGVEAGDQSATSWGDAVQPFIDGQIPLFVLQVQPPVAAGAQRQGRDTALAELACASGGQHFFLEDADMFSRDINLRTILTSRFIGEWRVSVAGDLTASRREGEVLMSTMLRVRLDDLTRTVDFWNDTVGELDRRLWLPQAEE